MVLDRYDLARSWLRARAGLSVWQYFWYLEILRTGHGSGMYGCYLGRTAGEDSSSARLGQHVRCGMARGREDDSVDEPGACSQIMSGQAQA